MEYDTMDVVEEAYWDLVTEQDILSDPKRRENRSPRVFVTWTENGLYRSIVTESCDESDDTVEMRIDAWYEEPDDPDAYVSMGTQHYRTIRVGRFPVAYDTVRDALDVAYTGAVLLEEDDLDTTERRDMSHCERERHP